MKTGVERALFNLKNVFGVSLDSFCDGVTVRSAGEQSLKYQEIESTLEKLDSPRIRSNRHSM